MVNSVSGVPMTTTAGPNAVSKTGAMDKVSQEQLYAPGAYTLQELLGPPPAPPKKKHGFLHFVGHLILAAAVVGGGLVGARKLIPALKDPNLGKELKEGAKLMDKAKYYTAKSADFIEEKALKVVDFVKSKLPKKAEGTGKVDTTA